MGNHETTCRPRPVWAALGTSVATLGAVEARPMLPGLPTGLDYTRGFAPPWITGVAAALGAGIALLALRRPDLRGPWRPPALGIAWVACATLLWSAAGLLFDLFRAAAVIGIPGLPPIVDWPGMACRAAALAAAAALALTVLSLERADGATSVGVPGRRWYGYAAAVLCLPYPLMKVYWALGGSLGWQPGWPRHLAVGELLMLLGLVTLSLALAQHWGQLLPRRLLMVVSWGVSAALLTTGALVAFGTLARALGIVSGPAGFDPRAWVVYIAYGDWLLLGTALAAATWAYQERRPAA